MSAQLEALHRVRPLRLGDLPEVLAIERVAYEFPWSEGIFRDCLRVGYECYVAVDSGDEVLGYGLLSLALNDAHVLNLCVSPKHRREGIASLLMEHMMRRARHACADSLLLEVRPTNSAAVALYRNLGFRRVGLRKRYYPAIHGREDALVLAKTL